MLDGCIVEGEFLWGGAMHLRGKSASIIDVRVGKWKQTWVDNEGGYLDFGGESKDRSLANSLQTSALVDLDGMCAGEARLRYASGHDSRRSKELRVCMTAGTWARAPAPQNQAV